MRAAMATTLTPELEQWIQEKLATGRYRTPEEVLEAARIALDHAEIPIEIPDSHIAEVRDGIADCDAGRFSTAKAADIIRMANGERGA